MGMYVKNALFNPDHSRNWTKKGGKPKNGKSPRSCRSKRSIASHRDWAIIYCIPSSYIEIRTVPAAGTHFAVSIHKPLEETRTHKMLEASTAVLSAECLSGNRMSQALAIVVTESLFEPGALHEGRCSQPGTFSCRCRFAATVLAHIICVTLTNSVRKWTQPTNTLACKGKCNMAKR